MTRTRPAPDHHDSPDAPPTAGLRCPRCGGAPALSVEDQAPSSPVHRFWAQVTCCRLTCGSAGQTKRQAVDHAAGRWLRLYPTPEESSDV